MTARFFLGQDDENTYTVNMMRRHTLFILLTFSDISPWICEHNSHWEIIQGVPLATEPGISLVILSLMRILQWNLKWTYLIV